MLEFRKLSNALGAEVLSFDFRKAISLEVADELYKAFLQYSVLLFRGTEISPEKQLEFTRVFGEPDTNEAVADYRHPDFKEVIILSNDVQLGKPSPSAKAGRQWHTDHSHTLHPTLASILHARIIPEVGGDTMFSNMYMAYETLSEGMKTLLDPLWAVHDATNAGHIRTLDAAGRAAKRKMAPPVAQPVVRIHQETGRKVLYVNEMLTRNFVDMSEAESQPLLTYLFAHAVRPEFSYRHQWRLHDVLVWDNRCMQHNALADFDQRQKRIMFRTAVAGSPSGYLVDLSLEAA